MSDEMTIAVLRSPISPDSGELTLHSYISHAQYAADLIDRLRAEVERLTAENKAAWDSAEYNAKRARKAEADAADLRGTLSELRMRYHCAGRRPEECHEMSLIDEAQRGREAE